MGRGGGVWTGTGVPPTSRAHLMNMATPRLALCGGLPHLPAGTVQSILQSVSRSELRRVMGKDQYGQGSRERERGMDSLCDPSTPTADCQGL